MAGTYSALAARVATAAVLIAALLAALFLAPAPLLAVIIAVLVGFAGHEWARLCKLGAGAAWSYAAVIGIASLLLYWAPPPLHRAVFLAGAAFWVALVPVWLWNGVRASAVPLAAGGFVVLLPAALAMMVLPVAAVLAVLVLVWVADIAAYFVGSRFGRHKLAPSISPGKTWEGAGGALAGVLVYATICGMLVPVVRDALTGSAGAWSGYLAAAAGLCAFSIVGDLFESAAKRQAGVKDSGTLLPGHGGILDRIDSATAALPLAALLWPLVGGQ